MADVDAGTGANRAKRQKTKVRLGQIDGLQSKTMHFSLLPLCLFVCQDRWLDMTAPLRRYAFNMRFADFASVLKSACLQSGSQSDITCVLRMFRSACRLCRLINAQIQRRAFQFCSTQCLDPGFHRLIDAIHTVGEMKWR